MKKKKRKIKKEKWDKRGEKEKRIDKRRELIKNWWETNERLIRKEK